MTQPPSIHAAGTVLWRPTADGQVDVAVVHRPRYGDWSLPKGKTRPGETIPACAVRETEEETGFHAILGRALGRVCHQVNGADKVVDYFAARARSGAFRANNEVDELRWVKPDAAQNLVSYAHDRSMLTSFAAVPADTVTALLVRHAKAGDRQHWDGPDKLRPLSAAGWQQAAALRTLLPLFGANRVYAAPRRRCVQTVEGLAADLISDNPDRITPVWAKEEPMLTEEAVAVDPEAAARRLLKIIRTDEVPVVCSQGGAIPGVIEMLADWAG